MVMRNKRTVPRHKRHAKRYRAGDLLFPGAGPEFTRALAAAAAVLSPAPTPPKRRARRPKQRRSTLERCGARTRRRTKCAACGVGAKVNKPCPSCGAPMPEELCQAQPVRDAVTGEPLNGRCGLHGGWSTGPTSSEGAARARANLELGRRPKEAKPST